jgi:hypothetical protein
MKIKTKSGFVCEIDENRADDWDFCDYLLMCDSQATMVQGIKKAVPFLLGEKNENALKEHVKEKDGRVPASKIIAEFQEILDLIKQNNETKKSSSSQA